MTTFNPYKITWAFLIPTSGIARKSDENFPLTRVFGNKFLALHAPSKERAEKDVEALRGTLAKEYRVVFITDKQFGMIEDGDLINVVTSKQLKEIFTIK